MAAPEPGHLDGADAGAAARGRLFFRWTDRARLLEAAFTEQEWEFATDDVGRLVERIRGHRLRYAITDAMDVWAFSSNDSIDATGRNPDTILI